MDYTKGENNMEIIDVSQDYASFESGDYVDFFNEDLQNIITDFNDYNKINFFSYDLPYANAIIREISGMCIGQTRGFFREEDGFFEEWLKEHNDIILITENNQLIGYCCIGTYDKGSGLTMWVRRIAVNPTYQGKGYGRKLLEQAIVYGKTKQAKRGFLHTDSSNHIAISLYNKYSFFAKYYD